MIPADECCRIEEWLSQPRKTPVPHKIMMQTKNISEASNAVCRNCRFYQPNGHRGGICQQFSVPVSGAWPACQLALPAFVPSWKTIEDLPAEKVLIPAVAKEQLLTVRLSPSVASVGHN